MSFRRIFALSLLIGATLVVAQAEAQETPTPNAATPSTSPAAPPSQQAAPAPPNAEAKPEAAPGGIMLGDATAGQGKAAVCGACHGIDGNSADKTYPKLAGQNEAYIARQLTLFKEGKRQNPIMQGFAAPLQPQDMHDIGAYFATKTSLAGVADQQLLDRGQALYRGGNADLGVPACMACHGPAGRGMAGAGYPQLSAQWTDYVQAKLHDWKNGTTWGDDANAKIMPAIAQKLGDSDIAAVSSYVSGLHAATAATPKPVAP
jgi:cbb3-type cytochrome c oxidase subunit III